MKNATLIYNPIAGRQPARRERQVREAVARLQASGMDVKLAPTTGPDTARGMAQAAVKEGRELILVCGGDGTLNEVINGIVPADVPLGILPGGTANIMARELGLPLDPVRAAVELPRWSPRRIAAGQVTWPDRAPYAAGPAVARPATRGVEADQRYFMSVAGIGFDAYIVNKLAADFKMSLGVVAYALEALHQSLRYSFPMFTCQVDGRQFHAPFAVVHRTSRYAGWLRLAPEANIFEPRFHLCLFKSRNRGRYFLYAAAAVMRQHLKLRDVELVEATQIVCSAPEARNPVYIELDGELVGQLPATLEVVPNALTLLVP